MCRVLCATPPGTRLSDADLTPCVTRDTADSVTVTRPRDAAAEAGAGVVTPGTLTLVTLVAALTLLGATVTLLVTRRRQLGSLVTRVVTARKCHAASRDGSPRDSRDTWPLDTEQFIYNNLQQLQQPTRPVPVTEL